MTPYDLLRLRCGLSQPEAAAFHGVRPDTVKSWCGGRNRVPPGPVAELRGLYARIEDAAGQALALLAAAPADADFEIGIAGDDAEAQSLGWPCRTAQAASIGLVVARADRPVRIVPRAGLPAPARIT